METKTFTTFETKQSKAGNKYYSFTDDAGKKHTCFEDTIATTIIGKIGQPINCEVVESNGFSNIRALEDAGQAQLPTAPAPVATAPAVKSPFVLAEPHKMMLLSYAKDLTITILEKRSSNPTKEDLTECLNEMTDLLLSIRARI